jgi:hypothetical protein
MREDINLDAMNDTLPEAERIWHDVFRTMPIEQKWRMLGQMWHDAKALHAAGVRARNPAATEAEIHQSWLQAVLEPGLYRELREACGSTE